MEDYLKELVRKGCPPDTESWAYKQALRHNENKLTLSQKLTNAARMGAAEFKNLMDTK